MVIGILLIVAIPAIVVAAMLYAAVTEMRHNRARRSRWDLGDTVLRNDRPTPLLAGRDN